MLMTLLIVGSLAGLVQAKDDNDKLERYIFPCHTTDYICFKKQFKALRDHVLLGNEQLGIDVYEPYLYKYGDSGTCIKLSGIEEAELVSISYSSKNKEFSMTIDLPFRIQQVKNVSANCATPDREFEGVGPHKGPLKRFSGNATVQITYPFTLRKIKGDTYLSLEDENLDVILDIPDLSHFNKKSKLEGMLYECSEWAYHVVQHADVGLKVVVPFTKHMRSIMDRLPLQRFLILYPEEEYSDLNFMYTKTLTS